MKFNLAEPTEPYFARWVSEGGKWQIGYMKYMYGVRFHLTEIPETGNTLDLCCGNDSALMFHMLIWVRALLLQYPEDVAEHVIVSDFPVPTACKPFKDPVLRQKIKDAADTALNKKPVKTLTGMSSNP